MKLNIYTNRILLELDTHRTAVDAIEHDLSRQLWSSTRHWYHPDTDRFVTIPISSGYDHGAWARAHADEFGIADDIKDIDPATYMAYDGRILFAAMKRGWVRILFDRRQPDTNSNLEGGSWRNIQKTLQFLISSCGLASSSTPAGFKRLIIVRRTGPDDDAQEEHRILQGDDLVEFAWGRSAQPPRPR